MNLRHDVEIYKLTAVAAIAHPDLILASVNYPAHKATGLSVALQSSAIKQDNQEPPG